MLDSTLEITVGPTKFPLGYSGILGFLPSNNNLPPSGSTVAIIFSILSNNFSEKN
jgi:hypothetical protein